MCDFGVNYPKKEKWESSLTSLVACEPKTCTIGTKRRSEVREICKILLRGPRKPRGTKGDRGGTKGDRGGTGGTEGDQGGPGNQGDQERQGGKAPGA